MLIKKKKRSRNYNVKNAEKDPEGVLILFITFTRLLHNKFLVCVKKASLAYVIQ